MALNINGSTNISTRAGGTVGSLDDLTDVVISVPTAGQVLTYNGTIWVNNNNIKAGAGLTSSNIGLDYTFSVLPATGGGIIVTPLLGLPGETPGVKVDSTVMRTTGGQTITGALTVSGVLTATNASNNLNASTLGSNTASFYRDASNINAGSLNAAYLATSGVTAGTYGSNALIPVLVVDNKGRITSASTTAMIGASETVSGAVRLATASETNTSTSNTIAVNPLQLSTYYAKKASPAFSGVPTAPTAATGTNTTQLATTAFVNNVAVLKAGDTMTGFLTTVGVEAGSGATQGVFFEGGKHQITNNDGGGNFNIRVGNTFTAGITEDGFAGHQVFNQTAGTWTIQSTTASQITGETPVWNNGVVFSAAGAITATGNITGYSDIRLKTDIADIPDALSKVNALHGVTYTRKDTGSRETGLIAQEVQAILPEAVMEGTDDNKTLSLAYGNLAGLLVEAIKELTTESKRQAELIKKQASIISELMQRGAK